MSEKILVLDDEKEIAEVIALYLRNEGYEVEVAHTGLEALKKVEENPPKLALLDVMLPDIEGFRVLQKIREKYRFPVIMLTAKTEDGDKITGLTLGADDYIAKPFNPLELVARVKAQLRRYTNLGSWNRQTADVLETGGLRLDNETKTVTVDGEPVSLTPIEYRILRFLMKTPGKVYSSDEIYRAIWKDEPYGSESAVAVHIRHIREKTEINPSDPRYLKVVWGQGYKIEKI